jgi:hypothetical protein
MLAICEAVDKAPGIFERPPLPGMKWLAAVEPANFINAMPYRLAFSSRCSRTAFFLPVFLSSLEESEKDCAASDELLEDVRGGVSDSKSSNDGSSDATPSGFRGMDFVCVFENSLTM